jgi:hypothetical protein
VLVTVRYFAERAVYRMVGAPPAECGPTTGMSRVLVTGETPQTPGARPGGYHLAADLRPFHVDDAGEFLGWLQGRLSAAGIERIPGGSTVRDGGLDRPLKAGAPSAAA